jgi:hypothetical protein
VVKWSKILYTLVNITGLQFFGREDPAVDEFFDNQMLDISAPLMTNERSLRVRTPIILLSFELSLRSLSRHLLR